MTTTCKLPLRGLVALLALAAALAAPSAAHAWWRGGVTFGFAPFYVPPPPLY